MVTKWRPFKTPAICDECKKRYSKVRDWQKFCSPKCQRKAAYREERAALKFFRKQKRLKTPPSAI